MFANVKTDDSDTVEQQITENKPYPGFYQAIWLIILYCLIVILLLIPVVIVEIIIDNPIVRHPVSRLIIYTFAISSILWYGRKKANMSFKELFPFTQIKVSLLLPLTITLIGLMIVAHVVNTLIYIIIPGSASFQVNVIEIITRNIWAATILMVIIGPFMEECLFRGLILRGFLNRYRITKAIMLSALIFGAFHLNIFQFFSAFLLGIFYAWLFMKTRSLLLCIFGHVMHNVLIIVVLLHPQISVYAEPTWLGPLWLYILGILLTGLGIWLLIRMFKKQTEGSGL